MEGLILIFLAGVAEFFKDLSEEGKLKGYWDKNHEPMFRDYFEWVTVDSFGDQSSIASGVIRGQFREKWWRVHWLQGGVWDYIPVWIRQYLAFRDGWHLKKFLSLTLGTAGYLTFALYWNELGEGLLHWGIGWLICRTAFSSPETIGRIIYNKTR